MHSPSSADANAKDGRAGAASMSTSQSSVTTLLELAGNGDLQAREQLYGLVERELRKRAHACLGQERSPHDLQTTMLVDDAFVKLVGDEQIVWQNRSQFYCVAARVMRRILVDEARKRAAAKRGGQLPVALEQVAALADPKAVEPGTRLALDEALTKLAEDYPDLVEIVELHFFAGWELKQISEEILHIPYTTIKNRWRRARAELRRQLCGDGHES